jgi:hypothetical protein
MPRAEIGFPETVLPRPNFHALSPPRFQRSTSSLMHSSAQSAAYRPELQPFCAFGVLPIPTKRIIRQHENSHRKLSRARWFVRRMTEKSKRLSLKMPTMNEQYRRNSIKLARNEKRDMSGFSFVLILMLLCEIAALQTDNPVFWLLLGPTPLALVLASRCLIRYRSSSQKSNAGRSHQLIAG